MNEHTPEGEKKKQYNPIIAHNVLSKGAVIHNYYFFYHVT